MIPWRRDLGHHSNLLESVQTATTTSTQETHQTTAISVGNGLIGQMTNDDIGVALNRLAREQMKLRLMYDIRTDIEVCKLEGIDYKEYLQELKSIIDGFLLIK